MNNNDLPPLPTSTPSGLYRHYKGMLYEVIGTARHSETLEPLTVYRALYGQHGLWVRPTAMFAEHLMVDGVMRPRFERCPPSSEDGSASAANNGGQGDTPA